jgi:septal ring factor EnvC (AmiA/AmiB activator)
VKSTEAKTTTTKGNNKMKTLSKELKTTIAMLSACLGCAFVAMVALFATAGGLDKLGTGVLLAVLVAFVAFGSAVIVDEYKSEQHANELRAMSYTLNAVRDMRDEYADTLAMVQADNRDDVANVRKLSTTVMEQVAEIEELRAQLANATKNKNAYRDLYRATVVERDEVIAELDEYRYTMKAEAQRVADI